MDSLVDGVSLKVAKVIFQICMVTLFNKVKYYCVTTCFFFCVVPLNAVPCVFFKRRDV